MVIDTYKVATHIQSVRLNDVVMGEVCGWFFNKHYLIIKNIIYGYT